MSQTESAKLISSLARYVASGKVNAAYVLPVIGNLAEKDDGPIPVASLIDSLKGSVDPARAALVAHLKDVRRIEALRLNRLRKACQAYPEDLHLLLGDLPLDAPLGWKTQEQCLPRLHSALCALQDRCYLAPRRNRGPRIPEMVERKYQEAVSLIHDSPSPFAAISPSALIQTLENRLGQGDSAVRKGLQNLAGLLEAGRQQKSDAADAALERPHGALSIDSDEGTLLAALEAKFKRAGTEEQRKPLLDLACTWPTNRVAALLLELCQESWAQERASLILMIRFGLPQNITWNGWRQWLMDQARQVHESDEAVLSLVGSHPGELLLLWYSRQPGANPAGLGLVETWCNKIVRPLIAKEFFRRWGREISEPERRALAEAGSGPQAGTNLTAVAASPAEGGSSRSSEETAINRLTTNGPAEGGSSRTFTREPSTPVGPSLASPPKPLQVSPVAGRPPGPAKKADAGVSNSAASPPLVPGLWQDHLQPFLVENWYMVAGIVMVIVGSSLLAYYTWDKHWLLRYTIMPALLGLFTASLARAGDWIERKDPTFKGTATTLRGAAIGLLPINFMTVALLAGDPQVPPKALAVPAMGLLYLILFGWGLNRWCAGVHPSLQWMLGGALLFINSLVTLAPLVGAYGNLLDYQLLKLVGLGFYAGFLVLAGCVVHFTRRVLTPELAEKKRVPWFFGATLLVTYLQVFAWAHASLGQMPRASSYSLMVILAGWLVLLVERRLMDMRGASKMLSGESFLGFSMVILGILMGANRPEVRILSLALAGAVWMDHALARQHPLDYWISLTLFMLSGASVGLLEGFPGPWLPAIGLILAFLFGGIHFMSKLMKQAGLGEAARGIQVVVLVLTAVVAPLAQWRFHSLPWGTAVCLLAVGALFAWRAYRDQSLRWVHVTLVILAVTLPYLGCVDLERRAFRGNTMVFGLAVLSSLWIGLNVATHAPLIRGARSTGLWIWGTMAVVAMALRVIVEPITPSDALWYRVLMDSAGPLLMTVVLVFATYYSRSLIPAGMAVWIVVILFPEFRAGLKLVFPDYHWGSGFGSACVALVLTLLAFALRGWPVLKQLGDGDRFRGKIPFPIRRQDYTLFTLPILASAIFLVCKVETWNLLRNLFGDGVQLKTALALGITGITWTLLAVYLRRFPKAVAATHLGWIWLLAGLAFGHWHLADWPHWTWPVLATGLSLQGLYLGYRYLVEIRGIDWVEGLLARPVRQVLARGACVLAAACVTQITVVGEGERLLPLMLFVAAQLVWHGLSERKRSYGVWAFFLTMVVVVDRATPGAEGLLSWESLTPALYFLIAVQAAHFLLESASNIRKTLEPLLQPFLSLGSALALFLGLWAIPAILQSSEITWQQGVLIFGLVLVTARTHGSAPLLLLAIVLGYFLAQFEELREARNLGWQLKLLTSPWQLAVLALVTAALGHGGRAIYRLQPSLLEGPSGQPFFKFRSVDWLYVPAAAAACLAGLFQTLHPDWVNAPLQLLGPYLGGAVLFLLAWSWSKNFLFGIGGMLVILGNIHAVRIYLGAMLLERGLSPMHLICLGLAVSQLQASLVRRLVSSGPISALLHHASLALAGLILGLLCANYFGEPNLTEMAWLRFIISGSAALLAGLFFRSAARRQGPGEEALRSWCGVLYHLGMAMAIACTILLLPAMRAPATALLALAGPAIYFYMRAETSAPTNPAQSGRYGNSATTVGFILFALYAFRGIFHMVLFPDLNIPVEHYHHNAPVILLLGLMLLRLHGLGGTYWLAFYGGLALMTGSYFLLTWHEGLSPFRFPTPSAWCAVGLAHLWLFVIGPRSPIGTGIQRLAAADGPTWFSLRRWWEVFLMLGVHVAVFWGLLDYQKIPLMVAPLLLGAASVLLHHGLRRNSRTSLLLACIQIFLALHADFLVESYLDREKVVWVLLGGWAAGLAAYPFFSKRLSLATVRDFGCLMALWTFAHVIYHDPRSPAGLLGVAAGAFLAAFTPQKSRAPGTSSEQFLAGILLWAPAWLVYFGQMNVEEDIVSEMLRAVPVLSASVTVLIIAFLCRHFQNRLAAGYAELPRENPKLFDQTLSLVGSSGTAIYKTALLLTFVTTALVQVFHYGRAFSPFEFSLLLGLYTALAAGWRHETDNGESLAPCILTQFCVLGFLAAIRSQLLLTTDFWRLEYDIWASLAASWCLTGMKPLIDAQRPHIRVPLLTTLLVLPAAALIWVIANDLGSNIGLLVVGQHSLMFAFMGKDDRESPYRVVAIIGFVSFVLIYFRNNMELEFIHAYVVPVGLGILTLVQMFASRMQPETRNGVRLVTLLSMLGSSGYYALIDDRYPVAFHLTLIVLCLMAMGLGSLLRVRLFLLLGFCGQMVDLCSLTYETLAHMERSARMSVVGGMVLVLGALLVFGTIYYKTHQAELEAWADSWRTRLGAWE